MNLVSRVIPHLCSLQEHVRDKRQLMMIRGFFDESNRNPNEIHLLITGWTATVEEWERFTKAWGLCLSESPSIRYFKLSEANGLSGEFARFNRKAADAKKIALAKVISTHDLRGYVSSAKHKILAGKPKELKKMMTTRVYDWVFMDIVVCVLDDHQLRGVSEAKIDFIFDACTELRACIESYDKEKVTWALPMQRIAGQIIPGDDKELAGLQAADFLAGEISYQVRVGKPSEFYLAMLNQNLLVQSEAIPTEKLKGLLKYATEVFERQTIAKDMMKIHKRTGGDPRNMTPGEFDTFSKAMETILKADPQAVKAAMDADKKAREEAQRASGKRGRGRPPKSSSASDLASS
jgi:hypothetical protein